MLAEMNEAQYRALGFDELEERRNLIADLAENPETPAEEMTVLLRESKMCRDEFARRNEFSELRKSKMLRVENGYGSVIDRSAEAPEEVCDPYDTAEYRSAFMQLINKGIETRTDQITLTTDAPVAIPTTLSNQIIEKLDLYGQIYPMVSKSNFKGAYEIPIDAFDFTAKWVSETEVSEWQKAKRDQKIVFKYHEFEARVMWSFLVGIVTFDNFSAKFQPKMSKAITKLLEQGIIRGTGTGQMLGITNDPRVTNVIEMTEAQFKDWKSWHSVFDAGIDPAYGDGKILMAKTTWNKYIDTMSDNQNAQIYYGYDPVSGKRERRLAGKDTILTTNDILPDFATANAGDVVAIYGDMSDYNINWQPGGGIQVVRYSDWDKRQNKLVGYGVCDGKVVDPYGFYLIKKKATTASK